LNLSRLSTDLLTCRSVRLFPFLPVLYVFKGVRDDVGRTGSVKASNQRATATLSKALSKAAVEI
jgi:hypothetical protein